MMEGDYPALIWCPFPDKESARQAAEALLGEQLIACANMLGSVESVFEWNGAIESSSETAVLFKTTGKVLEATILRLGALHPYDTPAIVGWRCDAGHPATLEWLGATIGNS